MINLIQHFLKKKSDNLIQEDSSNIDFAEIFHETDLIVLPSEGILYPNSQNVLKVRKLNFTDENILSKESYYLNNQIWRELINNIISPEEILTYDDLLPIDIDAILVWLRATAYGLDFTLPDVKCPRCESKNKLSWNLGNTSYNTIDDEYVSVLSEYGYIPFKFSEFITIGISIPTMGKIRNVDDFISKMEKSTGLSYNSTKELLYVISHIEEITYNNEKNADNLVLTEVQDIYSKLLSINLSLKKTNDIKKLALKINQSLGLKTNFICKGTLKDEHKVELRNSSGEVIKCDYKEENIDLIIGRDFFFLKEEE